MFAQPSAPSSLLKGNTFLLNPQNAGFLDGSDRRIHNSPIMGILIIMAIFGGIGALFGYLGLNEMSTRQTLIQQGKETTARVTDTEHTVSTDSKGHKTDNYYVTYDYDVHVGNSDYPTHYTYRQSVSSGTYSRLFDGDTISITYLPENPGVSRYLDDSSDNGISGLVIGGFFLAVALIFVFFTVRQKLRTNRLEAEGQILAGKIIKASGTRTKAGYSVSIQYQFMSPDGVELKRKESFVRNDLRIGLLPTEGTPVAVVYVNDRTYRIL